MTQGKLIDWERVLEFRARCRALVLQAAHAIPGATYTEARAWIREHRRFEMEDVGRRARELAREINPPLLILRPDNMGRVHMYPADFNFKTAGEAGK